MRLVGQGQSLMHTPQSSTPGSQTPSPQLSAGEPATHCLFWQTNPLEHPQSLGQDAQFSDPPAHSPSPQAFSPSGGFSSPVSTHCLFWQAKPPGQGQSPGQVPQSSTPGWHAPLLSQGELSSMHCLLSQLIPVGQGQSCWQTPQSSSPGAHSPSPQGSSHENMPVGPFPPKKLSTKSDHTLADTILDTHRSDITKIAANFDIFIFLSSKSIELTKQFYLIPSHFVSDHFTLTITF